MQPSQTETLDNDRVIFKGTLIWVCDVFNHASECLMYFEELLQLFLLKVSKPKTYLKMLHTVTPHVGQICEKVHS